MITQQQKENLERLTYLSSRETFKNVQFECPIDVDFQLSEFKPNNTPLGAISLHHELGFDIDLVKLIKAYHKQYPKSGGSYKEVLDAMVKANPVFRKTMAGTSKLGNPKAIYVFIDPELLEMV